MRWHQPERFTFLRWLTRFADLMGVRRCEVCLDAAWHEYRHNRLSPEETFRKWARSY